MRKLAVLFVGLGALAATVGTAMAHDARNFRAHLIGDNEVAPGVASDTPAQGQATFQLDKDGEELSYKLNVANIENVVAAHIHVGAEGESGPVAAFLYGDAPPGGGDVNGRIARGTITSANLINQARTGISTLEQLVAAMRAGNAYVNVHTNDGAAPTNTGPGDFPGGEIRGQIRGHGH